MAFVKPRSDGKFELVKSVREGKRSKHELIAPMGKHDTIAAALKFWRREAKAQMRKGETQLKAEQRRLAARHHAVLLERHLPPIDAVKSYKTLDTLEVLERSANRSNGSAAGVTEQARKVAGYLQKQLDAAMREAVAEITAPLANPKRSAQFEDVRRDRALVEKIRGQMFSLLESLPACDSFQRQLEAIRDAGDIASKLLKSAHYNAPSAPRKLTT